MSNEKKKLGNSNRHEFLIEQYFDNIQEGYAVRKVGKWVLVKQFNGGTQRWEVAVWRGSIYQRVQEGYQKGLFNA